MIFYFTGTGNSLYAARAVAEKTGERVLSMAECLEKGQTAFSPGERLGFVFPVYFMGLPALVSRFLKAFRVAGEMPRQTYIVLTCGFGPGNAARRAAEMLRGAGVESPACYSIRMTHNWTPRHCVKNKAKVALRLKEAERRAQKVADDVLNERPSGRSAGLAAGLLARVFHPMYERARHTSRFSVGPACIGCGVCARNCPTHAIEMRGRRPVWKSDKCSLCLGCLHRCPKCAIDYAGRTRGRGQYLHPCVCRGKYENSIKSS